jgi:hypothetical protein
VIAIPDQVCEARFSFGGELEAARVAIGAVSRKHCRELVTAVREKGLKIQTMRGIARTASYVLSQAVEDEHLPANPDG